MPPGNYILFAAPTFDAIDVKDPQVRRALEPYLKRVTVSKGEKVTIELSEVPASAEVW